MKKLILIMSGLVFLSGCSGVKQFTIEDFATNAKSICDEFRGTIKVEDSTMTLGSAEKGILDGIQKSVEAISKTGCSVHITATSCSFSCGGSDTPKIGGK